VSFQPSEFAKFALIFHLAVLLAKKQEYLKECKRGYIPLVAWIGGVVVLVFLQPNFSTGALIFGISMIMLIVGGVNWKHIVATIAAGIPLIAFYALSADYRLKRVLAFLGIGEYLDDPDMNYQVNQAIIGFGNGGLFGVGPGLSKQRDLFLPESYGDFAYAIVGEEYGFIGAVAVLSVFCLIMIRGMKITKHAPDNFGRYLAVGITSAITLYAIINAGVNCGLFPTTGLPMPLVSYGGTSILFTTYAIGVLLNISTYANVRPREREPMAVADHDPQVGKVY
jgi:cell division protein FtsW